MKIFVYTSLSDKHKKELKNLLPADSTLFFESDYEESNKRTVFNDADVVLGNPPRTWFEPFPSNLKFWQIDSAGFNQYQHLHTTIPVSNMGDFYSMVCAETIVGGLLAFYRKIDKLILLQQDQNWQGKTIRYEQDMLSGKQVLILGYGTIGKRIKTILDALGCTVKTSARTNPEADFHQMDQLLPALISFDVVINTLPGTAQNYVSAKFINSMKTGSVYANVGRAETTDEYALIEALRSGRIAGAILDVTRHEPLPANHDLWGLKNVLLTQHTGGGYMYEQEGKIKLFIKNLNLFLLEQPVENSVRVGEGY